MSEMEKAKRQARKLVELLGSQVALAKKCGVHPTVVCGWINGKNMQGVSRKIINMIYEQYAAQIRKMENGEQAELELPEKSAPATPKPTPAPDPSHDYIEVFGIRYYRKGSLAEELRRIADIIETRD